MPTEILRTRLDRFRKAQDDLKEARAAEFKVGHPARVNSNRYDGYGLIVDLHDCPVDQIAVQLENGNTWWYSLDDCFTARRDECPPWLQRLLKKDSTVSIRALKKHLKEQRF